MADSAGAQTKISFVQIPKRYYPDYGFRPNTQCIPMRCNFVFLNGGMGDYLCWTPAIRWLAEQATWIDGTWIVPTYFKELAEYWLKPYMPRWDFKDYTDIKNMKEADTTPVRGPIQLQTESLNATGAHLLTCGWVYYTNKEKAPLGTDKAGHPWDAYPRLLQADLDRVELPEAARSLVARTYAIITTGVTTPSRNIRPAYWNHVIEYVHSLGLIPVFLGKQMVETGNASNIHTEFSKETRFDLGINLLNQTTLMQAASIMSRAALVIGHDNGLLHLAGCTDVPIVFGYNLASPEHRMPRRPSGNIYNVILTDEDLPCNFCQSRNNFIVSYNFRNCFYGDTRCMDILFENGASRWKTQIDLAIRGAEENKGLHLKSFGTL